MVTEMMTGVLTPPAIAGFEELREKSGLGGLKERRGKESVWSLNDGLGLEGELLCSKGRWVSLQPSQHVCTQFQSLPVPCNAFNAEMTEAMAFRVCSNGDQQFFPRCGDARVGV